MIAAQFRRVLAYMIFFAAPAIAIAATASPEFWYGAGARVACVLCERIDTVVGSLATTNSQASAAQYGAMRVALQWFLPIATALSIAILALPPSRRSGAQELGRGGIAVLIATLACLWAFDAYELYLYAMPSYSPDLGRDRRGTLVFTLALAMCAAGPAVALGFSPIGPRARNT